MLQTEDGDGPAFLADLVSDGAAGKGDLTRTSGETPARNFRPVNRKRKRRPPGIGTPPAVTATLTGMTSRAGFSW